MPRSTRHFPSSVVEDVFPAWVLTLASVPALGSWELGVGRWELWELAVGSLAGGGVLALAVGSLAVGEFWELARWEFWEFGRWELIGRWELCSWELTASGELIEQASPQ